MAGGTAAITNAVKTSKHQAAEEEEEKRHNREMEKIAQNSKIVSMGSGLLKKIAQNSKIASMGSGL
jgi:fructoselysine-6-P-deglycase FrlB-like protein